MSKSPDFIIIGAMKCATTTLHEQLAAQPGIFMTEPKEPNFFSNDEIYHQGWQWYQSLYAEAQPTDLCGESSTHYTKLPTYPKTIKRLLRHVPNAKFIYVMRDPVDRLVSQYIHEWTQRRISSDINQAIYEFPPLIEYSRYSMQLAPYFRAFGPERVLPVFLEKLQSNPQAELERICRFIGYGQHPIWNSDLAQQHVSSARTRKSAWRDALVEAPGLRQVRRTVVPKPVRNWVRSWWQMKQRPELSPKALLYIKTVLDKDLNILGNWLGLDLNCDTFKQSVLNSPEHWINATQLAPKGSNKGSNKEAVR